jgi:hypothetical protein
MTVYWKDLHLSREFFGLFAAQYGMNHLREEKRRWFIQSVFYPDGTAQRKLAAGEKRAVCDMEVVLLQEPTEVLAVPMMINGKFPLLRPPKGQPMGPILNRGWRKERTAGL